MLLRDDGIGHAEWIDRHVEDLNKPYGLAWQVDHVLLADHHRAIFLIRVPGHWSTVRPSRFSHFRERAHARP